MVKKRSKRGKVRGRTRHDYTPEQCLFILNRVREGNSYSKVGKMFKSVYGWTPSLGKMSKICDTSSHDVKPMKGDMNGKNHEKLPIEITDEQQRQRWYREAEHEMLVTTYKNLQILAKFVHDPNASPEDRIKRVHALLGDMNSAINTFFTGHGKISGKGGVTVNAGTVNMSVGLDVMTPEQREQFYDDIMTKICAKCRYREAIDVEARDD